MSDYYDWQGNPITYEEWKGLYRGERHVAVETVDEHWISTVWLGHDPGWPGWGEGPPLIFETMIFGGAFDKEMWHYSTEAEARVGHAAAVKRVRERGC